MEEDDDDLDNQDELNEKIELSVSRFEEMIRKQDRYFFDVDALIRIIDFYIEKGEYQKALEVAKYAFSLHPNSVNFLMKQAHLFAITGQDQRALDTLDRVERISPYDLDLHLIRGNIYNTIGQYSSALECFKKALPLVDMKDEIYFSMAITYQNMLNYPKAIEYFKMAVQQNPTYELAMEELAACLGITGKLQEGISYFKQLIDKDPYSYAAWYNLGDINCRLGNYEEALHAFDYCILIKEDYAPAYLDQAQVLAMLGHYEDAIQKYKQTFEYYKPQAWFGIAITLESEERWYEAIHYVRKAIEKDEHNGEYWLLLGDCEFNLNNITEAGECYIKVVEDDPGLIDGWLSFAHFLTETGKQDEAVEITEKGLTYHPECAELYYRQTANLYSAGALQEAYEMLEVALLKDIDSSQVLFEMLPALQNDQVLLKIIANKRKNL
ncbi:MAG: tetratricopeptide repeat protein [Bacteroidetes bacterium]|nr:tetratricopeptide repeat protein [Bacteroidota bacterium]